jgi:hypothetical protein
VVRATALTPEPVVGTGPRRCSATQHTLLEEVGQSAQATHAAKMRGLYADVDDDGTIREPAQLTRLEAAVRVGLLGHMLKENSQLRAYALADPATIVELHQRLWTGDGAALLERVAHTDSDALLAEVRGALRGEAPFPDWAREMATAFTNAAQPPSTRACEAPAASRRPTDPSAPCA